MIIAQQKELPKIVNMLEGAENVLLVGCRSCVAICLAGGEKEVGTLAEALRVHGKMNGNQLDVVEMTLERACEKEFARQLAETVPDRDVIVSLACGVGAQVMQELYPRTRVLPGLDTSNMGAPEEQGVFMEKCGGCGDCVLHLTGGICPIARCAKSLLNGPCGGSNNGKCEISPETPCAWDQIYRSLERLGRLDLMEEPVPPKDWRPGRDGGPRRIVRKDAVLTDDEKRLRGRER